MVSRAWLWARRHGSMLFLVTLVVSGSGANLLWTSHAIQRGAQQWCAALNLLTREPIPKPADPKANPSREQNYEFYVTLLILKHNKGCD